MTPQEFIKKWKASTLKERSASQEHFIDLCNMIGHPTPATVDKIGDTFTFERGASKTGGSSGWADVWKKGCFGWEYKGKKKDLTAAFSQLQGYAIALENPPLLVVSDMDVIIIHTNFTNTVPEIHTIHIDDIGTPENQNKLKMLFNHPEKLKPGVTTTEITSKAAEDFAVIAQAMRDRGHDPLRVAHFLNKMLFCMFAEDVDLLPNKIFEHILSDNKPQPKDVTDMLAELFEKMASGGRFGITTIEWFNGGLFDGSDVIELEPEEIKALSRISKMDWGQIEPSIFGTLFERGLDPAKRSQLGAHYTDPDSIMRLIQPVLIDPLLSEWKQVKAAIVEALEKSKTLKSKTAQNKWMSTADKLRQEFLLKLRDFRILDPACGSGNFLYMALKSLKDIEYLVNIEAEQLELQPQFSQVGPQAVLGIELNTFAAELARVTIWIGEIQWMLKHSYNASKNPILKNLNQIDCRDALLNEDGSEAQWPEVDVIVGNPPFIGDKKMIRELGEDYVTQLRKTYKGRVPGGADFVTYWFEKARYQIQQGNLQRAGFVATNSIRQGKNRQILKTILSTNDIYHAWSDEPWVNDGAAVRVSFVCMASGAHQLPVTLNGMPVENIYSNLSGGKNKSIDLTKTTRLMENVSVSFFGLCLAGKFKISGDLARKWLLLPSNPNGSKNSDILRPILNGMDITARNSDKWVIDFGPNMSVDDAALYEEPFQYIKEEVYPVRKDNRRAARAKYWWRHGEARPGMRQKMIGLSRCIVTPETAKHRFFVWMPITVAPEHRLVVITRSDDTTLGILSSKTHLVWALIKGGSLEDRPVYNTTQCFLTFPFPDNLQPNNPEDSYKTNPHALAISEATRHLVNLRNNWLNPPEWVKRISEVVPGYPDRIIPVDDNAAKELKKRTLTNLYNLRPTWLDNAHKALDEAVAAAYGWDADLSDDEILSNLLALNLERSKNQG